MCQALRTHFPGASAWTEWQHQSDSVTSLATGAAFATSRGAGQGDVLGTIQSALVLGHARDTHMGECISATNGLWMMDKCLSGPGPSIRGFGPWTLPSPPLGPPEAVWHIATSRALPVSCARPSACWCVWSGTRRASRTPSLSSARTRGPQHGGPPSALASTSTRSAETCRTTGPSHGALSSCHSLRGQPHHVAPLGLDHGRPFSAPPLAPRVSRSWLNTTCALKKPSRALSRCTALGRSA